MEKIEGNHSFSGSCAPGNREYFANTTFSIGIFQWVSKAGGKGLKKSAVKYRIIGLCSNPEIVYKKAKKVCEQMDNGWVPPTKSTRVY